MSDPQIVNPEFLRTFNSWFNVDLINLDDTEELQRTAGICASDLMKQIPDTGRLIEDLSALLAAWTPQVALQFVHATDVDWLADHATELKLTHIVSEIVHAMRTLKEAAPHYPET